MTTSYCFSHEDVKYMYKVVQKSQQHKYMYRVVHINKQPMGRDARLRETQIRKEKCTGNCRMECVGGLSEENMRENI